LSEEWLGDGIVTEQTPQEFHLDDNRLIAPGTRISRSMAEVLFLFILFCIFRGSWSLQGVTEDFVLILGRTAKTVGSSLRKLSDLTLLSYFRSGQKMLVSLNLSHEFIQSLLVRLFGASFSTEQPEFSMISLDSLGFIPVNLDFDNFLVFLSNYEKYLDTEIETINSHLSWLDELDMWEKEVTKIDFKHLDRSNPLVVFAESLVSRFEFAEKNSVNRPRPEQLTKIISQALSENLTILPWVETLDFRNEVMRVDKGIL